MNLYLDDNACKGLLMALLLKAGHQVTVPRRPEQSASRTHSISCTPSDTALSSSRGTITILKTCTMWCTPPVDAIPAIRADNDVKRDMKDRDIVRAIAKLASAGVAVANEFHVLNHWR